MKVVRPREQLRPYVRYYWMLTSDEAFSVLTFPIGCPQIIFHRKTPLYIPEINRSQSRLTISGQVNIQSDGNLEMIVAVFYPHTIGMFIDTPPSAFYNQEISGYDISNRQLDETAAKIFDSQGGHAAIAILENWLLTRISPTLNHRRISGSIDLLMRDPAISVYGLADTACLSLKQYARIFREQVGMNPKEYARVVRFQKALWVLQRGTKLCRHFCRVRLCRPVTLYPRVQGHERTYPEIASQSLHAILRPFHQSVGIMSILFYRE